MKSWSLQDAENQLNSLVDGAIEEGPQMITRHGLPSVVVLSVEAYQLMARRESLADILPESSPKGCIVDRSKDVARDFLLE